MILNFRRIKWAFRKVNLPISGDALVLDVGSGGHPYARSDILMDRLTGGEHRCNNGMIIDRPTVFGDALKMPFKDKSFDFIVASHILEHMSDPVKFISELERVGKAGYIETPNVIFERLIPYDIHCLEIASVNGTLHIYKKTRPVEDPFLGTIGLLNQDLKWKNFFHNSPDMFHVRHFWKEKINYFVHNKEVQSTWIEEINSNSTTNIIDKSFSIRGYSDWRGIAQIIVNKLHKYGRSRRLKNFQLNSILVCPECRGELVQKNLSYFCQNCCLIYPCNPYPDFTHSSDLTP